MSEMAFLLLLITLLSLALSSLRGFFDDAETLEDHARRVLGTETA